MEYKAKQASLINFIRIVVRLGSVFLLSMTGTLDVKLLLTVQIVINLFIFMGLFFTNRKTYKLEVDFILVKPALKFGTGLILGSVSTWVLSLIDRRFISEYHGLSDVGIYSLAATIGMLISPVFLTPFRKVFTPFKFSVYNKPGGKDKIIHFYNVYIFLCVLCVLGLSLYGELLIHILATKEYYEAAKIIPLIAISYFFWGLNEFYGLGVNIKNKTFINSLIAGSAALMNVLLNVLLVPNYGIYGAAVATIMSYFFTNVIYFVSLKVYFNIEIKYYNWIKFFFVYLSLFGVHLYLDLNLIPDFFLNLFLIFLYILTCFGFKFITPKAFKSIKI